MASRPPLIPDKQAKTKEECEADAKRHHFQESADMVAKRFMAMIPVPPGFARCDGHYLYDDNYRVNVYVRVESPTGGEELKIADSRFVTTQRTDEGDWGPLDCRPALAERK